MNSIHTLLLNELVHLATTEVRVSFPHITFTTWISYVRICSGVNLNLVNKLVRFMKISLNHSSLGCEQHAQGLKGDNLIFLVENGTLC